MVNYIQYQLLTEKFDNYVYSWMYEVIKQSIEKNIKEIGNVCDYYFDYNNSKENYHKIALKRFINHVIKHPTIDVYISHLIGKLEPIVKCDFCNGNLLMDIFNERMKRKYVVFFEFNRLYHYSSLILQYNNTCIKIKQDVILNNIEGDKE